LKSLKHLFFKQVGQSFNDMFPNDKNKREFLDSLSELKCWDFKRTPLESGLFQQVHSNTRLTLKESEELHIGQKIESKLYSLPPSEQISFAVYPLDTNNCSAPKQSTEDFTKPIEDLLSEPKTPVKPIARAMQVKTRMIEQMSKSQKADKKKTEAFETAKKTPNHKKSTSTIFNGPPKELHLKPDSMLITKSAHLKDIFTFDIENKENLCSSNRLTSSTHLSTQCLQPRSPLSQQPATQGKSLMQTDSSTISRGMPGDSGLKASRGKTAAQAVTVFDEAVTVSKAACLSSTTEK